MTNDQTGGSPFENWADDFSEELVTFLRWFGHFISLYASIESDCHVIFRRHANVTEDIARAITGGMRVSDLLPVVALLVEKSEMNKEDKRDFKECVEQLDHLTMFRNRLIHRGFRRSEGIIDAAMGKFISTNALTAKSREAIETLRFDLDDIKAAAKDCYRIHIRLQVLGHAEGKPAPSFFPENWQRAIYGPWLYKPVQPEKRKSPPRSPRQ
jgi:hypothetical protein